MNEKVAQWLFLAVCVAVAAYLLVNGHELIVLVALAIIYL